MLVLAVTWIAKQGKEAKAASLLRVLTAEAVKEPGCRMFVVHTHNDRPGEFFIYEQYKDAAALDAHRATPHFQKIARGSLLEVADRKEGNLYTPLD